MCHDETRPRPLVAIVAGLAIAGLLAGGLWQPHDPGAIELSRRFADPSLLHPLGTDQLGRDMLSRLMAGGLRTAIVILIVCAIAFLGGVGAGTLAALLGGRREALILRLAEVPILIPTLVVGLATSVLFGLGPVTAGLALGLAGIGPYALMAHGLARRVMGQPYYLAARALGAPTPRLARRHVLPAIVPVLLTHLGANAGSVVIAFATLAFLGLGADTSKPDWGAMIFEYRVFLFDQPRLMLLPGLAVAGLATLFNLSLDRQRL